MSFSRIRRNKSKVAKATHAAKRGPTISTWLGRGSTGVYSAYACVGMGSAKTKPLRHARCSRGLQHGRTPQAALAKALKSLSQVVARRGRK